MTNKEGRRARARRVRERAAVPDERGERKGIRGLSGGAALERIPRWVAPVVYAVVTIALFREFVFSNRMLYGVDTLGLGYMARAFFADALRTTGFPLWNPVILGGTPFLDSLAGGDSLYPPSLLLLLLTETHRALGWKIVLHVFLAGVFMHAWLRALGVSRAASLLGGLAYLLTPSLVSLVFPGHDGKIFVTALTPLLFWSVEWTFRRAGWLPLAAAGAIVSLIVLTTHFQLGYFLCGAAGAYAVFRAVQLARAGQGWAPPMRRLALFVLFCVVGAGAAGVQLIPAVAYVTEHSRRTLTTVVAQEETGVAYSSSWSLHPEEAVGLVVPEFVGSGVGGARWADGTYWGQNPLKYNHEYLGIVALLLAALSFLGARERAIRWFLVALGGGAILFGLGAHTPVWRIAYEVLPGISLFRAPSTAIFLSAFSVTTLAAFGVDRGLELLSGGSATVLRVLGILGGALFAGALVAWSGVLLSTWTSLFPILDPLRQEALARATPFISRGFLFAVLLTAATLAVWWASARGRLNAKVLILLLGVLISVDQFRIDYVFVRTIEPEVVLEPDPTQRFLMERAAVEPRFRVFSAIQGGQDVMPGLHGIDLAAGHHPNDLGRYREMIGMEGSGLPEHLVTFNPNVMRLLNIRYVLWPGTLPAAGEPVAQAVQANGQIFASVYSYPGLPRARLVGEALVVEDDRVMPIILGEDDVPYDPSAQTILTAPAPIELEGPVDGTVTWLEETPNRLVLRVQTSGPSLLVLSENWYPAWRASVDGQSTPVLRADHTLRAVAVPAGAHRVEMWYESRLLSASMAVSAVSALILLGAAGAGFRDRRRGLVVARAARAGSDDPGQGEGGPDDVTEDEPVPGGE